MNRLFPIIVLSILAPLSVPAVEITVGTARLSIPSPSGYAPVTSDMQPYAELAEKFVPPSNKQFALFLPEADVAAAARGEIPTPLRWFYVQTTKELIEPFVSSSDFAQLRRIVKAQNEDLLKQVESQMPGIFEKLNKGFSADYEVDLNLSLDQMLPFPPHHETERSLAYSTLLKYNIEDEEGKPSSTEGVVTTTFVHLQGKVLFLYANAEKTGLDWCRAESQKWTDAVVAANPSSGDVAVRESKSSGTGFDWSEVLWKTIGGAVIGGIVGALGYGLRKMRGKS